MKKIFLFFSIILSLNLTAQNKAAEKFAATITPADLKEKLSVIAGAEMEGRETATEGQRKAATYIEDYFKKLKLSPGDSGKYQMPFPVYQDSLLSATVTVNNTEFAFGDDFAPAGSGIPSGSWKTPLVVFAGDGVKDSTHNDYDSLDLKGKWVMIAPHNLNENSDFAILRKTLLASGYKADGLLIVSDTFPRAAARRKGMMYNAPGNKNAFPALFISKKLARQILGADTITDFHSLARKGYETEFEFTAAKTQNNLQSTDVIGVLPGTDKKSEYVFITAHYDHLGKRDSVIYYGADDDGSGTSSVLEIAEAFAAARDKGIKPRRTIVFMTVSGEEKGLWGSAYYTDHPVFPLDSTSIDLNVDMVGRIDPTRTYGDSLNYVYTIGEHKISTDLKRISDSINKMYSHLELDRKFNDPKDPNRFYYRSDHFNFAKKGVPIIFYFNGTHADYHRPTDTVDKINFELMAKRVKLVFYTAWEMANRNEMVKRDKPLNE
ncbi:MAG TPA: M28 family peptidase [Parafilimonas sp.]|nr:M28 family peptidase [Parafilimonas sp.]